MNETLVLTIAAIVVGAGFTTLITWVRRLHDTLDRVPDNIAMAREQMHSRINVLMSEVAGLKATTTELSSYIKHNANDLWIKRDELFEKVAKCEGRLDHVTAELARICAKEV